MSKDLKITPISEWGWNFQTPLIMTGPCSVESEEQVRETAKQLSNHRFDILRGGIWKPRTRPNSFEGIGSIGLKWLKDAGNEIGKPVATEVANVKHVMKHFVWE
jgi:chorismate mutase